MADKASSFSSGVQEDSSATLIVSLTKGKGAAANSITQHSKERDKKSCWLRASGLRCMYCVNSLSSQPEACTQNLSMNVWERVWKPAIGATSASLCHTLLLNAK